MPLSCIRCSSDGDGRLLHCAARHRLRTFRPVVAACSEDAVQRHTMELLQFHSQQLAGLNCTLGQLFDMLAEVLTRLPQLDILGNPRMAAVVLEAWRLRIFATCLDTSVTDRGRSAWAAAAVVAVAAARPWGPCPASPSPAAPASATTSGCPRSPAAPPSFLAASVPRHPCGNARLGRRRCHFLEPWAP